MDQDERVGSVAVTRRQAVAALSVLTGSAAAEGAHSATPTPAPAGGPASLLYPHESSTRATRDLSGMWRFQLDPKDAGEAARWFEDGLPEPRQIPVPSSWNDLFDDARNYFGTAWYETEFRIDGSWMGRRLSLRFGSAVYRARVWLNGQYLGEHVGGHLPFAFDISGVARADRANRLVVSVENRLQLDRVPAIPDPKTARLHTHHFPQTTYDFFPYCGLHRPVLLTAAPRTALHDLTVKTGLSGGTGEVDVAVEIAGGWSGAATLTLAGGPKTVTGRLEVRGGKGRTVLKVPQVRPWSPQYPHLYTLTIRLGDGLDEYSLKVGVRTIAVKGSQILLNGKPIWLTGFGKHEDFALHGRGLDLPALVRDFELLKWLGANSFRTSHYPYAEEALALADEYGFLVIDETPGVSLVFMDPPEIIAARYRQLEASLTELMHRDKNRTCVIMWSLANEPIPKPFHTVDDAPVGAVATGETFFRNLFAKARSLDAERPVCLVSVQGGPNEWVGLGDVICTNSYNGWYAISGRLDDAATTLDQEITALRARHGDKPIVFTEFGADAVAGMHAQPAEMWTEEYQADLIEMYWKVIRKHDYIVGAHPWAFADFKTPQSIMRVGALNHKGVFTRDRRPKLAATRLRELWRSAPR